MKDDDEIRALRSQLAETKQRLDALVTHSLDAIIAINREGDIVRWNPSAEAVFGWDAADAVGRSFAELIVHHDYRKAYSAEIASLLETGQAKIVSQRIEMVALRHDETQILVEVSVIPGQPHDAIEFTVVIRKIPGQKAAQSEIEDRESQLAAILNSKIKGIYYVDLHGNCTFANSACARLLGYETSSELLGLNMHQTIHHTKPDGTVYSDHECQIYRAFRDGEGTHVDNEVLWRKDGSSFPAEYWSYPIKIGEKVVGALLTFLDISQRKEWEIAQQQIQTNLEGQVSSRTADLAATRKRLKLSLLAGNIGLWDWNAETDEVYFSETYKRQLGYPGDEPWSNFDDWQSRIHPDDHADTMKCVNDHFAAGGGDYKATFRMQCKDKSYRWFLAQGKASFSDGGKATRMLGVHIDVTQRMQDERELERLNEALEKSNLELQQFAYIASHDLQTPLRAIAGFAQFLQSDYGDKIDETATDYIHRIVKGAERMQKMIDDLLMFSRVESRAKPFDIVDMNAVYADVIYLLSVSIDERHATITCDLLPSVTGDEPQLVQLFQNLIGNSLKYCDQSPVIHVAAEQHADSVVFTVTDNGIGIDESQTERIFEVFKRLHSRDTYPGTGIGLAVCRRIALRHGGSIWVESAEGSGSTFKIKLPLRDDYSQQ